MFLSKDLLPESRIKSPEHEQVLKIAQKRDQLVKTKIALLNKIYGILNGYGVKVKKEQLTTMKGFARAIKNEVLSDLERTSIEIIKSELISLRENIKKLEKLLESHAKNLPDYKNLISIKGIDPTSTAIIE